MMEYIWLVPAFPLLGVVINGLFGRSHLRERAHFVAVPAAGLSFLIALLISLQVFAGQTSVDPDIPKTESPLDRVRCAGASAHAAHRDGHITVEFDVL